MISALSGLFHICYSGSVCVAIDVICHLVGVWGSQDFGKEGGDGALQPLVVFCGCSLAKTSKRLDWVPKKFALLYRVGLFVDSPNGCTTKGPLWCVHGGSQNNAKAREAKKCPVSNATGEGVVAMTTSGHAGEP